MATNENVRTNSNQTQNLQHFQNKNSQSLQNTKNNQQQKNQQLSQNTKNNSQNNARQKHTKNSQQNNNSLNSRNKNPQEIQANCRKNLEHFVQTYKIFIDTCSLLSNEAGDNRTSKFWEHIIPLLLKYQSKIFVPEKCKDEVEMHAKNKDNEHLARHAKEALVHLKKMQLKGFVDLRNENDNFADNVFHTVFAKFRINYPLLLITQDRKLSQDILSLNAFQSAKGYEISVRRIDKYGFLSTPNEPEQDEIEFRYVKKNKKDEIYEAFFPNENGKNNNLKKQNKKLNLAQNSQNDKQNQSFKIPNAAQKISQNLNNDNLNLEQNKSQNLQQKGKQNLNKNEHKNSSQSTPFRLCEKITSIKDEPLNLSKIPEENDIIFDENDGQITLLKRLANGGEGAIYETNKKDFVAKIYFKENNTTHKFEKLKIMISKHIRHKGICFPTNLLFNDKREFVGYLMPKASGRELGKSLFIKPLFEKHFSHWNKKDTITLCLNILDKIKFLHSKNVILGDINPANILIVSANEIYFVDTDSYQIEDFPCPVGTINFTAPEIQRKKFGEFLRTKENENFALATLLFMIMLPGKPPYAQLGGEDQVSNIISGNFSYPLGDETNQKAPDGPWRFMWSHLLFGLKEAFYNTFKMGGLHFEKRLDASEWIRLFRSYLQKLDDLEKNDEMAVEIYPTRFKKHKDFEYVICEKCGDETKADSLKYGLCYKCLNDRGEVIKCAKCKKEFLFSNYEKLARKKSPPRFCETCFLKNKEWQMTRSCSICGKDFELSVGEYESYQSKGLSLPKRCKECRTQIKQASNFSLFKSKTIKPRQNALIKFSIFLNKLFFTIIILVFAFAFLKEPLSRFLTPFFNVFSKAFKAFLNTFLNAF